MADRVIVYLPTGQVLALDETAFRAGLAAGQAFAAPATSPVVERDESWHTADDLERLTGVTAKAWREKAKAGEVAHIRVGRSYRFPGSILQAEKARATAPAAVAPDEVVPWKR